MMCCLSGWGLMRSRLREQNSHWLPSPVFRFSYSSPPSYHVLPLSNLPFMLSRHHPVSPSSLHTCFPSQLSLISPSMSYLFSLKSLVHLHRFSLFLFTFQLSMPLLNHTLFTVCLSDETVTREGIYRNQSMYACSSSTSSSGGGSGREGMGKGFRGISASTKPV